MPSKKVKAWEAPPPARKSGSIFRSARNAAITAAILLLIAYVTGLAVGRTDGFRAIVAERLSREVSMPVRIDRVSLSAGYNLTLREVASDNAPRPGQAGLRAQRVDIKWRWSDLWHKGRIGIERINVVHPIVAFARNADGKWEPEPLAPLAEQVARYMQIEPPNKPSSEQPRTDSAPDAGARSTTNAVAKFNWRGLETAISVQRGEISWWLDATVPQASAEGITVHATPITVPGRRMTHLLLRVQRASTLQGPGFRDLTVELLEAGDQDILLRFTADRQP
jgi:hypothetical protein